jgi:hypothetical protein
MTGPASKRWIGLMADQTEIRGSVATVHRSVTEVAWLELSRLLLKCGSGVGTAPRHRPGPPAARLAATRIGPGRLQLSIIAASNTIGQPR